MIDAYLWGKVDRISPEAPVPVVVVNKRESRLGGAANVALNVQALGATPVLCSVIGNDAKGIEFVNLLKDNNISDLGIIKSDKRPTTTKFRIFGNNAQMLRVDEEISQPLENDDNELFIKKVEDILSSQTINSVIIQDYDKGVISKELLDRIVSKLNEMNIPIAVDPKKRNFNLYKNVSLFKPNLKELREGLKLENDVITEEELAEVTNTLLDRQNIRIILTTLSEKGVYLTCNSRDRGRVNELIPAQIRSIADVSGAGDTVISTAAICLGLDLKAVDIAFISNMSGGLVCEQLGVVPVDKEILLNELKSFNQN
jgi:rfaE bifunctional protein kinase chain/domain